MAENKVRFLRGTAAEYADAVKDNDTIYFTTDDGKFYVGNKEITSGGSITIDDVLSDTSENPVQNKVIKASLDEKASKTLYSDTTINVGRKANTTVGEYSIAEGIETIASGAYSHAEGIETTASGIASHAEGVATTASGGCSHAEGDSTIASGACSHAEGDSTTASGDYSHAGGHWSQASGESSFSHGTGILTQLDGEVAFGEYNIQGRLFSIGDGTADDERHNAFEITPKGGKLHDKNIATEDDIPVSMTGATSSTAGTSGLVPAPASGDQNKFLRGDGTWQTVNSGGGSGGSSYRKMTAIIDMENSNPETSVTYADDAVNMTPKSSEWDDFFGEYPVLFKDGIEIGKLNPNNFTQFEDGTSADITTGESGDVMIAFPRRGVKISTTYDNKLIVSMTDDPNNSDFTYYAHERGITSKDVFYLGTYEGSLLDDKLRSLSGKEVKTNTTTSSYTSYAHNNGDGYEFMGFYQFTFIQCMYILKYKNLNSQEALGQGYTGGSSTQATGTTNTNGMDYGTTDSLQSVKLFGLEDIWGNVFDYVCGIKIDSNGYIYTNINNSKLSDAYFVTDIQTRFKNGYLASLSSASSEIGFIPSSDSNVNGSSTTYFCDETYTSGKAGYIAKVGGCYTNRANTGIFHIELDNSYQGSEKIGTRLMYL